MNQLAKSLNMTTSSRDLGAEPSGLFPGPVQHPSLRLLWCVCEGRWRRQRPQGRIRWESLTPGGGSQSTVQTARDLKTVSAEYLRWGGGWWGHPVGGRFQIGFIGCTAVSFLAVLFSICFSSEQF